MSIAAVTRSRRSAKPTFDHPPMLIAGMLDGASSDVALDTWRALDRRQVDGSDMVAGHSTRCHLPCDRLRMRSDSNASGATDTHRA